MTRFQLFLLILGWVLPPCFALCSMYGVCHTTPAYFNYCPATNESVIPQPLPEKSKHLEQQLRMKCPYLFTDGNRNLCCDPSQVEALFKMISIANSLFSRCPSCMDNFWKYWCMYTCSADQKNFLTVLDIEPSPTTNRSMVVKVRYDLSRQYAEETYESCKNVKLASASGSAMLIMCGRLGLNETCTLDRWFNFMGTRSDALGVPVDILHHYHNVTEEQLGKFMHMNTTRCDQSPRIGQAKCMPMDCPLNERREEFKLEMEGGEEVQESCILFGLGCSLYFLLFSVVIFIAVLTCAFLPYLLQGRHGKEDEMDTISTISSQAHWIPKQIQLNSMLFIEFVSKQPYLTLLSSIFFVIICCTGLFFLVVISNPIEVWVSSNSRAIQEKEVFDSHFGPFYRVQQIIFYPKPGKIVPISEEIGPVFQKNFMKEIFHIVKSVFSLNSTLSDGRNVSLGDICYRPMGGGYDCLVNSPSNYFGHDPSLLDLEIQEQIAEESFDYDEKEPQKKTYLNHLMECIGNPYTMNTSFGRSCLAPYGGPTYPYLVFGNENQDVKTPLNSTAVIISIPLSSKADLVKMKVWEKSFIQYLKSYKNEAIQLSFMAERSIQDEITRASESDAITVCIALLLMMLYSVFALGKYKVKENRLTSIFIHSKVIVGFCGMLSVFSAIASSLGILSFYGLQIPSAAIVMNSFITILIGCNRIFAVVWTSRKELQSFTSLASSFHSSLSSAFMCTLVQSAVFFTGALISVPAVRSFCLLSALSIVLQLLLLCIMFLPIYILDSKREKAGRPEFCCCKRFITKDKKDEKTESRPPVAIISQPVVQITTLLIVLLILFPLPWSVSKIHLGLDQKLAVPQNSYMYTHFKNIEKYMNIGPPVYFIIQGDLDFSKKSWQDKFCSLAGCEDNSIGGILSQAADKSEKSYITGDALNWLDNYLEWLAPESQCCTILSSPSFTDHRSLTYCTNNEQNCSSCSSYSPDGRPSDGIFYDHLKHFLEDVPGARCMKGGRAAFHSSIHLDSNGHVDASHFMTFHVALRNSSAYINAMNSARLIARRMEIKLGGNAKVFPYSMFYVYYEQFTTIRNVSAYQLIFAFSAIFLGVFLLIGFETLLTFVMIFVSSFQLLCQITFMALWNIDLNSISAVNLVLAVAINVEYCLPILVAYNSSVKKSEALEDTFHLIAPSSIAGLTVPMILGTVMLTFAQSPFFNVYFFRILIVTALSASFSGLLLLPVLILISLRFNQRKTSSTSLTFLREMRDERRLSICTPNAPLLTTVL